MKRILFVILLLLPALANAQITYDNVNKIATIAAPNFGPSVVVGLSNAAPEFDNTVVSGWTVRVNGSASIARIEFHNLNGAPDGIKITNYNDQVRIVDDGINFINCRNVTIAGDLQGTRVRNANNPADTCYMGFVTDHTTKYFGALEAFRTGGAFPANLRDGFSVTGTSSGDITFRQCYIKNCSGAGFKSNQATAADSMSIYDSRVHGTIQEAVYFGPTSGTDIVHNVVRIERCEFWNTYRNAVQVVGVGSVNIFNKNEVKNASLAQPPGSGQGGGFACNGFGPNLRVEVTNNVFRNVNGELLGFFMNTPTNTTAVLATYVIENNLFDKVLSPAYFNNRSAGTNKRTSVKFLNNTMLFGSLTQIYPNLIPLPTNGPPFTYTPPDLSLGADGVAVFFEAPTNSANTDTLVYANNIIVNPGVVNPATFNPLNARANLASNGTDPATGLARRRDNILQINELGIGFGSPTTVELAANAIPRSVSYPDYRVQGANATRGARLIGLTRMGWPAIDQTPPLTPDTPTFSGITQTSATATTQGSNSTDVARYVFFLNNVAVADSSINLSRNFTNLMPATEYQVRIQAVDADGNRSRITAVRRFNTLAAVQTTVIKRGNNIVEITMPNGRVISCHKTALGFEGKVNVFTLFAPGQSPINVKLGDLLPAQATFQAALTYLQSLIE
jgi:hypothetical protein